MWGPALLQRQTSISGTLSPNTLRCSTHFRVAELRGRSCPAGAVPGIVGFGRSFFEADLGRTWRIAGRIHRSYPGLQYIFVFSVVVPAKVLHERFFHGFSSAFLLDPPLCGPGTRTTPYRHSQFRHARQEHGALARARHACTVPQRAAPHLATQRRLVASSSAP